MDWDLLMGIFLSGFFYRENYWQFDLQFLGMLDFGFIRFTTLWDEWVFCSKECLLLCLFFKICSRWFLRIERPRWTSVMPSEQWWHLVQFCAFLRKIIWNVLASLLFIIITLANIFNSRLYIIVGTTFLHNFDFFRFS